MDDAEEGVSQSTFPDPPPFYKLYTPENVQKGTAPPPPPPVVGNYSVFGTEFDVCGYNLVLKDECGFG